MADIRPILSSAFLRPPITLCWLLLLGGSPSVLAEYRHAIGYERLRDLLGPETPDGSSVAVAQIEWDEDRTRFAPNPGGELSGTNFHFPAWESEQYFGHATDVARRFYGRETSIAPGISEVSSLGTAGYIRCLRVGARVAPFEPLRESDPVNPPPWQVENHSWVGTFHAFDHEILRRTDYSIARHNLVSVAGLDNRHAAMRPLLANFHNGIAVGVASGNHNRGGSTLDQSGRVKPDIVVPIWSTSYASAVVSAAAALLIDHINRRAHLEEARNAPVIKTILLAGASKKELPDWSNTETRPLDRIRGAGSLNVYHSYRLLDAGRHWPGGHKEGNAGWDWNEAETGETKTYYVTVSDGQQPTLSAAIAWNRRIVPSPGHQRWYATRDRFALRVLRIGENGSRETVVARSEPDIDNVGHIFRTLSPGTYAIQVSVGAIGSRLIADSDTSVDLEDFRRNYPDSDYRPPNRISYGLAWRLDYDFRIDPTDDE